MRQDNGRYMTLRLSNRWAFLLVMPPIFHLTAAECEIIEYDTRLR